MRPQLMISMMTMVGKIEGMFTCQMICIRLAPSMNAASCREGETLDSVAR